MVNALSDSIAVDLDRVYATGHSNGGMFSHRIAVELPHIFAAVAPGAATIGGKPGNTLTDDFIQLEPTNTPIPMLLYHGKRDSAVKLGGGRSGTPAEQTPESRIDISFDESTAYWLEVNGCTDDPIVTRDGSARIKEYSCTEASVKTLVFDELGHSYPDPDDVTDFDFGEALLSFFNAHRRGE
jgi:polyhydroxybutyrate depolymerase